jgi:hypothetical protein
MLMHREIFLDFESFDDIELDITQWLAATYFNTGRKLCIVNLLIVKFVRAMILSFLLTAQGKSSWLCWKYYFRVEYILVH